MNNNTHPNQSDIPRIVIYVEHELFDLGQVLATPQAMTALGTSGMSQLLSRHKNGDWGVLPAEDNVANEEALLHGDRILSRYNTDVGDFYVITEADRSYTTVLYVWEY